MAISLLGTSSLKEDFMAPLNVCYVINQRNLRNTFLINATSPMKFGIGGLVYSGNRAIIEVVSWILFVIGTPNLIKLISSIDFGISSLDSFSGISGKKGIEGFSNKRLLILSWYVSSSKPIFWKLSSSILGLKLISLVTPSESIILKAWYIWLPLDKGLFKPIQPSVAIPDSWSHTPLPLLKLNFDGASKGNPSLAGIGGAFRNHLGDILHIFSESMGINTNNVAELQALVTRLTIAKR